MCKDKKRILFVINFLLTLAFVISLPTATLEDQRIVGGENTTIDKFPHQVSVRRYGYHTCGGSIFKFNIIITAAHCISQTGSIYDYWVVAGATLLSEDGIKRQAMGFRIHPDYARNPTRNDIALLFLSKPLYFSKTIQPITLPKHQDTVKPGTKAVVSGWGTLSEGGSLPDQLQYVNVHVVSNEECEKKYGEGMIDRSMVCAGEDKGGKDSCQGDSGGPLTVGSVLVGIVSWGYGCARPDYPGVYARVSELVDWVHYELEWFSFTLN